MKLIKQKQGSMFLHTEIGKGKMPDGREVRLIQTNGGIHMQVYSLNEEENKKGSWDTYSLTYEELSQSVFKEIIEMEKYAKENLEE